VNEIPSSGSHGVEGVTTVAEYPRTPVDPAPAPSRAPAVVAVVVSHDPGPWFDDVLASLRDQDYPNLSVLVIDADSDEDPLPRVA